MRLGHACVITPYNFQSGVITYYVMAAAMVYLCEMWLLIHGMASMGFT